MEGPASDPLDLIAVSTHLDDLPRPVYVGPVAGPDTPQVVVFDCPVLESPDRPYLRNVLFVVTLAGQEIAAVRAHECNGVQHPGLPTATIIGASESSWLDALKNAALATGVTE